MKSSKKDILLGETISRIVHKPITYFDEEASGDDLDLQIKIKVIEKELLEIKKLLKNRKS